MADPRRLAAALAPFHEVSKHLEATQARLSGLLAAFAREAEAHTGDLERLPAAARFNPFAVLPKAFEPAHTADPDDKVGGRRADKGSRAAQASAPRPAATGTTALASLAGAAGNLRQASGRTPDIPPSAAALTPAALGAAAARERSRARAAGPEPMASLPAREQAAHAYAAGELIDALLKRHAPPRAPTRLHGIGTRSAQASHDGDAAPAQRVATTSAARAAQAAADHPALRHGAELAASAAAAHGALLAPGAGHGHAPPSRLHAASAPWGELSCQAATQAGAGMDAAAMEHGDEALRRLLDSGFAHPATVAQAFESVRPETLMRAPTRSPQRRAPSRLLGASGPQDVATAPATSAKAATATPASAMTTPAPAMPADGAADLAAGLDRLLREQAWLRGVDLT